MQCENGYTKQGVKGILCRKAEEPKAGDLRSVAHAMCGHQRFCPNARCYQFLPGWEKCTMRDANAPEATQKPKEAEGEKIPAKASKSNAKRKRAQKAE